MENVAQPEVKKGSEKEIMVYFRCSREMKRALRMKAAEMDSPMEDVCVEALRRYLIAAQAA